MFFDNDLDDPFDDLEDEDDAAAEWEAAEDEAEEELFDKSMHDRIMDDVEPDTDKALAQTITLNWREYKAVLSVE